MPGWVANRLEQERAQWFLWSPICLALGCGVYFGHSNEPPRVFLMIFVLIVMVLLWRCVRPGVGFAGTMLLMGLAGYCLGAARTAYLTTPILDRDIRAALVDGWVETSETQQSGRRRLVVRVIGIDRLDRERWPRKVRLTDRTASTPMRAGDRIRVLARLLAPSGPVAPGAFDYARYNWFRGIGATGFVLSKPIRLEPDRDIPLSLWLMSVLSNIRYDLSAHVQRTVPGTAGGLIAALITGDRSSLDDDLLRHLRQAGLAHLLAISGLHMSLVAGTLYQVSRRLLSVLITASPGRAEKRAAALTAWFGALAYLGLSGGAVSTQRAFIMLTVMFLAIILDRQAITMRNLAIAAWPVILIRPESVVEPGLQMSFLTVAALIFFYQELRSHRFRRKAPSRHPLFTRGARGIASVAMTTVIAGIATAPVAAFHFHQLAAYSLAANLVSVPIVGLIVMPCALAGTLLVPFGLDQPFLAAAAKGVDIVIHVASTVSGWEGAVVAVPVIPQGAIIVVVAGLFWLMLWRGTWRWYGLIVITAGCAMTANTTQPDILVEEKGRNIGFRNQDGLFAIASARRAKFVAGKWLLRDGDPGTLKQAAARHGLLCDPLGCSGLPVNGLQVAYVLNPAILDEECRRANVIISTLRIDQHRCRGPTVIIDRQALRRYGAHAITFTGKHVQVHRAHQMLGNRPWVRSRP